MKTAQATVSGLLGPGTLHARIDAIKRAKGTPPWSEKIVVNEQIVGTLICQPPGHPNDRHYHLVDEWWLVVEGDRLGDRGAGRAGARRGRRFRPRPRESLPPHPAEGWEPDDPPRDHAAGRVPSSRAGAGHGALRPVTARSRARESPAPAWRRGPVRALRRLRKGRRRAGRRTRSDRSHRRAVPREPVLRPPLRHVPRS